MNPFENLMPQLHPNANFQAASKLAGMDRMMGHNAQYPGRNDSMYLYDTGALNNAQLEGQRVNQMAGQMNNFPGNILKYIFGQYQ